MHAFKSLHSTGTLGCAFLNWHVALSKAVAYATIEYERCSVIIIIKYYHDTINNKVQLIQWVYYLNFICLALKFN